MLKTLAAFLAMFLLSSCAMTVGRRFDVDAINQLLPEISTKQEVIERLGPPSAYSAMANGGQLLQWQYVSGSILGASGAHAAILFDKDDKMVRVTFLSRE